MASDNDGLPGPPAGKVLSRRTLLTTASIGMTGTIVAGKLRQIRSPTAISFWIDALVLSVNAGELAMAADGLTTIKSNSGPQETMAQLEAAVTAKGMTVFAHINHGAGAIGARLPLRPTELLIFGSPKGGTPVMQSVQTAGIDLPLKALVWQDDAGITWLSYNAPAWIADRHGAGPETKAAIRVMAAALDAIAAAATSASANR